MNKIIQHFQDRPILLNIILDGYGIGVQDETDAVFMAKTPVMDKLMSDFPNCLLFTHGKHVGLPSNSDMGGSEVGHMTIGAGRIISQGTTLISRQIASGEFFKQKVLNEAIDNAKSSCLHLIGLLSDGNIHSHMTHWFAIINFAAESGVKKCRFHVLLDGRDVGIQSAQIYVQQLEDHVTQLKENYSDIDYRIASGGGREFMTMDRSYNWNKVKIGWEASVEGFAEHVFDNAYEAIDHFRAINPNIIDQDIPRFVIRNSTDSVCQILDGDSVISVNFRGDRAIELTRAFCEIGFKEFEINRRPKVYYCGMTIYDLDLGLPQKTIVPGINVENPFGKRILEMGIKQFRLAETQKFPHVTFFYNGGYREPLDSSMEEYCIIPSDVIASFSEKPAMKAVEISNQAVEFVESGNFQYGLINFANPDMVGHTGDFNAVVKAVEIVDKALGRVLDAVEKKGGTAIVTADHGNADQMIIMNPTTGNREISTKHSLNPVPLVLFDPKWDKSIYQLKTHSGDNPLTLGMIAATNFVILGVQPPDDLLPPLFKLS